MDSWTCGPVDSWTDFFLNLNKIQKKHRGTEYDFSINMYHAALPRFTRKNYLISTPPTPPNDLVIVSAMKRTFYQNGVMQTGKLGNVYFHSKTSCIQRVQPAFLPFLVVIPTKLRPKLLDVHRQYLCTELGLVC